MAKTSGPLLSNKASGSVSPALTFSERKTGSQVRFQRKQKLIKSTYGQADQKSLYRLIYARWLSFSDEQREAYNQEAKEKRLKMSGWNLFLKLAVSDPKTYLGLVGYWSMNRKGYGTILDISKNDKIGTLKPNWPDNCPLYVDSKNKKLLNALSFDGEDDYVQLPTIANWVDENSELTVEALIKCADIYAGSQVVIWHGDSGLWALGVLSEKIVIQVIDSEGNSYEIDSIDPPSNNTWYHVATTWKKGGYLRLYVNNVLQGEVEVADLYLMNFPGYLGQIGQIFGGQYFKGLIDEVLIYTRALEPVESKALYN